VSGEGWPSSIESSNLSSLAQASAVCSCRPPGTFFHRAEEPKCCFLASMILQVATAWEVLPRTHAQRVILAQHFPRLLGHILNTCSSMKGPEGSKRGYLRPVSWRLLHRALQQGISRRKALLAGISLQAAMCRRAKIQSKQRLSLPERMRRVELAIRAQRHPEQQKVRGPRKKANKRLRE